MSTSFIRTYVKIPLITRMTCAFILGSILGLLCWYLESIGFSSVKNNLQAYVSPFGSIFIHMLKMVVIPIVFFSLVQGASQLPISKLGNVGLKLMLLYLFSSFLAAAVGVGFALLMDPGSGSLLQWSELTEAAEVQAATSGVAQVSRSLFDIAIHMFANPFAALAESNFLGMIVFSILIGLSLSAVREKSKDPEVQKGSDYIRYILACVNAALHKLVSWIMEYAPIGVLALTIVNFGVYGTAIVGPYLKVVGGIILAIFFMIFAVYASLVKIFTNFGVRNFFNAIKEPMLTAFVTRSSAAALPISMDSAINKLGINKEIASFALPMGATINMDGVCVHLPMFAILAANLFGLDLGFSELILLVTSTVLAAVGTGGVPGGSLMLLFIVLGSLGLSEQNTAIVISLALGVNPILDMFETMNNVTGDLLCTFLVGKKSNGETI